MGSGYIAQESRHIRRTAKDVDGRVGRVSSDHGSELRDAVPAIGEDPKPEVGALTRSAQSAPSTAGEPKVDQHNGICGAQSHLDDIIRAKIAVEDPAVFPGLLFL